VLLGRYPAGLGRRLRMRYGASWPPTHPVRLLGRRHHRGGLLPRLGGEKWLSRFSWVALVVAIIVGIVGLL